VPRLYEKVHTAVLAQFEQVHGPRRRLLDWALGVGRRVSVLRQRGEPVPRGLALKHRLADRLVYSKVKNRLGGRLRLGISGGAPLAKEIAEFFHSIDILIIEGWGLTECTTAASVNRPSHFRFGTVGPALPGCEVHVGEDGELLIRSPTVFAGYYKDEEATREVLGEDGWLRSGDLGAIDDDGFITITDRKKDILITAGGKNVSPSLVENRLRASPYVSEAAVFGEARKYLVALLEADGETVAEWARGHGVVHTGYASLVSHPDVVGLIEAEVKRVNGELTRVEQVKAFRLLPRELDPELEGEPVTPTRKVKRRVMAERYRALVESMYANDEERRIAAEVGTGRLSLSTED
jgi:long-chain acyl-CoA synthetase